MAFLKDEEKKVLLDRYVDIEWPDDVDDLRCVRCDRVVINHHMSNCHHLFCNNCRRVFSDGGQWKCLKCHEYVTQLDDQDFDVEVKIHKIRIFCPNKKYGCKYEDQLRNIPKHLMTCVDTREAALPAEYAGTNRIEAVVDQLTKVSAAIGELREGMSSMLSEQVKKFDDVNSQLNLITDRMNGIEKRSEELESASVKYTEEFGSIKSLLESVNQRVQQNELTMEQMSLNIQELRSKMASMTQKMETLEFKKSEELNSLKAETYEWTIRFKDAAKTILEDEWRLESEAFKFTGYKYEIRAMLIKKDGEVAIFLQFKDGNTFNKFLNKNGFTTVKYVVKDQSDILKKQHIIRELDLRYSDCFGTRVWIFGCGLSAAVLSPPYLNNDCIKVTMSFEPSSIDHSFVSNDGVLRWRVNDYKRRKQEQMYSAIWSPTFYTSPQGYRVKTRLGINKEGFTIVEVHFLTGEHDDSLSINWSHMTTVTLFNQLYTSKNLVKRDRRDDVEVYAFVLENSGFFEKIGLVKDDSLLLTVAIEHVNDGIYTK